MNDYPAQGGSLAERHSAVLLGMETDKSDADLIELYRLAAAQQRAMLETYPGGPDELPLPFRADPEFCAGMPYFLLLATEPLDESGTARVITRQQHRLLGSTNALNDWWMDETGVGRGENDKRNYESAIEAFDAINALLYGYADPSGAAPVNSGSSNPEIRKLVNYYDYVLNQMPPESRASIARLLVSINLYQGISLYQERDFRQYINIGDIDFNGRDIADADLQMLQRMQVEKGGFLLSYVAPYYLELTEAIDIPDSRPTLQATIQRFLDGHSLYRTGSVGEALRRFGGVLQVMDDSFDSRSDWSGGMLSPQNVGPSYRDLAGEDGYAIAARTRRELGALLMQDFGERYSPAMQAVAAAVAGLTRLYLIKRHGSSAP